MGLPIEVDFGGDILVCKEVRTGAVSANKSSTVAPTTAGGTAITVSRASHLGRTILLDSAPTTATLPAATGTGDTYKFLCTHAGGAHVIQVANATDTMVGIIFIGSASAQACAVDVAGSTDDTLTMNATTTGGIAGGWVEMSDIVSGKWYVKGILASSGTAASAQFSAAVS